MVKALQYRRFLAKGEPMSKFVSTLKTEWVDDTRARLIWPLVYNSDVACTTFLVKEGFETDFASVPRIPFVYVAVGDTAHAAAVLHDYLYTTGEVPRSMADAVFKEAAQICGVSGWRAWILWAGVRIGGGSHYKG